jgi:hypothetical protein
MQARRLKLVATALTVALTALVGSQLAGARTGGGAAAAASPTCALGNKAGAIKHVIYLQFDNTHFNRDRSDVASDLQQMPHLLDFLRSNGTLFTNDHTILISHTAGGILSSLTGLYPDRTGQTVSNSYGYFPPTGIPAFSSSFKYWTDLVDDTTGTRDAFPNMVTAGKTTPAPWVPYTRAGCDFGGVGTANIELENTGTGEFGDMTEVFGAGSPEWNEASASNAAAAGTPERAKAQTDFVGIAVHCASGGGLCTGNAAARPDKLPDEPGGYAGFLGLFGAKYVNPAINHGSSAVNDTSGQPIVDPFGQPGFPGFDGMLAKATLGYIAQMQEAGVPVTYGYISDAHDNHQLFRASGPGEADYRAQLAAYDDAFAAFFDRLKADGITKKNTLFVVTVDEGDHYAGGVSADGTWSHTFCNVSAGQACPANQIGEVNLNINSVLPAGYTPPAYSMHADSAPTFYVNGNPAPTDPTLRQFERNIAAGQAIDPYVSPTPAPIAQAMVDRVGEQALHMVSSDPQRVPNFTLFANPDYFVKSSNTNCPDSEHSVANCIDYHFAWSHGDIQPEIGTTWVGFVGPGIHDGGIDAKTWTDHANVRPTMLTALGLEDQYGHDGHTLLEALAPSALPRALAGHPQVAERLGAAYEQLNAPFGAFSKAILEASTKAVGSGSAAEDSRYSSVESRISDLTGQRDALASRIKAALTAVAFGDRPLNGSNAATWIDKSAALIARARALAASA